MFKSGKKSSKALTSLILVLAVFCSIQGCAPVQKAPSPAVARPAAEPVRIRISVAGDFLMHLPLVTTSKNPGGEGYDFKDIFMETGTYLAEADFTVANLETRLAGPAKGYTGYPLFNTPAELAVNMKELGIDLVTTANNHTLDMGREGVGATLDNLDRAGLQHIGSHRTPAEKEKPAIFDIKGMRVGFINYTQDTNGIPVPSDAPCMVNVIKREDMLKDINSLVAGGSDIIIACMHLGDEYQRRPNEFQQALARELFEAGVDVVLNSHPHVMQPLEWQSVWAGGREKRVLAAYSLGNFVSNQNWRYSDCGMILDLEIIKTAEGASFLTGVSYVPVWVHTYRRDGMTKYRVLPVKTAISNYESEKDPLLTNSDYELLKEVWQDTTGLMGPQFHAR